MLAILQFDSVAVPLMEAMIAQGRLPAMARLRGRGCPMAIDAAATFLQSSTYMTLCTGVDVRDHGIYSAVPWSAPEQRPHFMYAFDAPPTIWDRLTARGRSSLIVDPTLAWLPREHRGVFLGGWQFEDRLVARGHSVPRRMRRQLAGRFGAPPRLDDVYGTRQVNHLLMWRDRLVEAPGRVADASTELLRGGAFDFAWINFGSAHKAGHHLWDPAAVVDGAIAARDERALQEGLAEVYEAVDRAIGRIVDALPPDADVIVFSPTGMAANTSRADLLPGMVDAVLSGGSRAASRPAAGSPIWALRSAVPASLRQWVARALPDDTVADIATRLYFRRDWSRTRAVAVPGENKGYIRVNLKGREREGVVEPSDVPELLDTIIRGLLAFREPDGSVPISRVERMADLDARGSCVDRLPDLVVHWGPTPPAHLAEVTSPVHGVVRRRGVGSGRSGNHVDEAWAVMVPGKARMRDIGRAPRITDIGATACAMLGADLSGLSGTSLLETR